MTDQLPFTTHKNIQVVLFLFSVGVSIKHYLYHVWLVKNVVWWQYSIIHKTQIDIIWKNNCMWKRKNGNWGINILYHCGEYILVLQQQQQKDDRIHVYIMTIMCHTKNDKCIWQKKKKKHLHKKIIIWTISRREHFFHPFF